MISVNHPRWVTIDAGLKALGESLGAFQAHAGDAKLQQVFKAIGGGWTPDAPGSLLPAAGARG